MEYRTLSTTDLKVSKICLGTMNMGTYNTEEEAREQLDYAISQGVNFIDTAEAYPIPPDPEKQGRTETFIGNWLKNQDRKELIITSKVTNGAHVTTREQSPSYGKKMINEAIDGTLNRLGTDYVDLYLVHWPDRDTNRWGKRGFDGEEKIGDTTIEETVETLAELQKAGKIRYFGVSNETPWGISEYLRYSKEKNLPRIVAIQNQYSLLNRTFEVGLSEFAFREGVELCAYSPLSKGSLTGKYIGGVIPPDSRFAFSTRDIDRYNSKEAQPAIEAYVNLAKEHGLDPSAMALAFVNTRPFLATNIIGARTMEQLKTDIGSIDLKLSDEVIASIDAFYKKYPDPHA